MKKGKKLVAYLIVILSVIIIAFLFLKIFKFDKKVNVEYPEVTEADIKEIYKFFPERKKVLFFRQVKEISCEYLSGM